MFGLTEFSSAIISISVCSCDVTEGVSQVVVSSIFDVSVFISVVGCARTCFPADLIEVKFARALRIQSLLNITEEKMSGKLVSPQATPPERAPTSK